MTKTKLISEHGFKWRVEINDATDITFRYRAFTMFDNKHIPGEWVAGARTLVLIHMNNC